MLKNEVINVLEKRINTNDNDSYTVYKYRDKLVGLLGKDAGETIKILYELNEKEVLYISEVFEEIAEALQSCDYIECLWKLAEKFPKSNLERCVETAEKFMDEKC